MSRPNPSDSYPNAILVSASSDPPRKEPHTRKTSSATALPWVKLAIAGGIAWVLVVVAVAGFVAVQGNSRPIEEAPLPMPAIRPNVPVVNAAPKAAAPQELKPLQKDDFVDCAQIGTEVRFLKDPAAAFQRAAAEKKMVFMMHLSGNLEDKDFT